MLIKSVYSVNTCNKFVYKCLFYDLEYTHSISSIYDFKMQCKINRQLVKDVTLLYTAATFSGSVLIVTSGQFFFHDKL